MVSGDPEWALIAGVRGRYGRSVVSRFVRRVRTASGAVAVQVVTRQGRAVISVDHVGSARTDAELALLLAAAGERLRPGQEALDLGDVEAAPARLSDIADWTSSGPPADSSSASQALLPPPSGFLTAGSGQGPEGAGGRGGAGRQAGWAPAVPRRSVRGKVVSTSSLLLWDVLARAYADLGFDALGDSAFRAMVLARIVEPASKADTVRVLDEVGVPCPTVRTLFRSLARCQERDYRGRLSRACAGFSSARGGLASLIMYDCTTLLCRRRHNSVYADLVVMPMSGGLLQVMPSFWFRKSAYS